MCLMIKQTSDVEFDFADLQDFYKHNSDGIGVMYVEGGEVKVVKALPNNEHEAWAFYLAHVKGRDCVWHLRMKTHGTIVAEQSHPFEVIPGVYLAHNGVLAIGNAQDTSISDTQHYIAKYLKPMLEEAPGLIHNPGFQSLLSSHIGGGNRFALMDKDGIEVINEHHGTTYKGAWLSNTYAWSSPSNFGGFGKYQGSWGDLDDDGYFYPSTTANASYAKATSYKTIDEFSWIDEAVEYFFQILENGDLWTAYQELSWQEVDFLAESMTEAEFYDMCDDILNLALTDAEVIEYVRDEGGTPMDTAVLKDYDEHLAVGMI